MQRISNLVEPLNAWQCRTTELDELLLQQQQEQPATVSGSSNGACRPATAVPSFRLLVLATTSRPKALDDGLAPRLGANGCLLAVSG